MLPFTVYIKIMQKVRVETQTEIEK